MGEGWKKGRQASLFILSAFIIFGAKIMTDFSKVRARKEEFLKRSMLPIHGAHAENSLVTSFHVTGFRISAHLTCSGRGWGWGLGSL